MSWSTLILVCSAVTLALVLLKTRLAVTLPGGFRLGRERLGACPHLGLAGDPFARLAEATDEHRCYVYMHHDRVDLAHQQRFCLTANYRRCPFLMVKPGSKPQPAWERLGGAVMLQAEQVWALVPQLAAAVAARVAASAASQAPGDRQASAWGFRVLRGEAATGAGGVMRAAAVAAAALLAAIAWAWRGRPAAAQLVRAASPVVAGVARLRLGRPRPRPAWRQVSVRLTDLAQTRNVPVDLPVEVPAVADSPTPSLCDESVHRADPTPRPEALGPSLLARSAAREADLLERGIAAFESGHEAEAYELFKQAVERNPRAERAWFWRAKTAQTLDEVIQCLERALELDPANQKVRANLTLARQRREREKLIRAAAQAGPAAAPARAVVPSRPPRPGARRAVLTTLLSMVRAGGAAAAIILGAAWIAGGLPVELRKALEAANADILDLLPIMSVASLSSYARLEPVQGYNVFSAVPYVLGFLALLVGSGLLNRERWTVLWGPLLGLATAWLWLGVLGATPTLFALALCGLVALGGLVATRSGEPA